MTDTPFPETHRAALEIFIETWAGEEEHTHGAVAAARAALAEIDRLTTLVHTCANTECMALADVHRLQDEAITRLKAQRDRAAEKGHWNDVNATDETLAMLKGLRDDP